MVNGSGLAGATLDGLGADAGGLGLVARDVADTVGFACSFCDVVDELQPEAIKQATRAAKPTVDKAVCPRWRS